MRRAGLIALVVVAVACSNDSGTPVSDEPPDTAETGAPAVSGLSATIELSATTVRAGSSIDAVVTVQNDTGAAIEARGCRSLFNVALANDAYDPSVAWLLCGGQVTVPEGRSTYSFDVAASYLMCAAETADESIPECANGQAPPLPPGDYEARLYQSSPVIPDVAGVDVSVTE